MVGRRPGTPELVVSNTNFGLKLAMEPLSTIVLAFTGETTKI